MKKSISSEALSRFFRSLALLLGSGIGILSCIEYLIPGESVEFSAALEGVAQGLREGKPLSRALREQAGSFDSMSCDLVEAAEKCGRLTQTFERLGDHHARSSALERRLKAALAYPAAIFTIMLFMVAVMAWFVFPQEKELLDSLNTEVPWFTELIFEGVGLLFHPIVVVSTLSLAVLAAVTLSGRAETERSPSQLKKRVDSLLLNLPIFGQLFLQLSLSRMLHVFGMLNDAGCTVDTCLRCSAKAMQNATLKDAVEEARQNLTEGMSLTQSIAQTATFPVLFVQLFAVAEESGQLVSVSQKLAAIYEARLESSLDTVASLVEPAAMLVVGTLVGSLVLATMLPTVSMVENL